MATAAYQSALNVEISSDGATVTLKPGRDRESGVDPQELIAHLRALGVLVSDPTSIEKLAGSDGMIRPEKPIIVVEGKRPKPETPATLELLVTPPDPDACDSYYEHTAYLNAKPGQAIGLVHPAIPGEDGVDVFGNPIAHKKARNPEMLFGENVELDTDGVTVRATSIGRIFKRGERLWVNTALEVPGDVDFACCNVNVSGDVDIRGSVLDRFKVSGASIYVGGAVEAAEVIAAGDLHIHGGIIGKEKGRCVASGDITCRYISNATLEAGGDVRACREIANSRIVCGGRLTVERGPLTSGHVTANGGVSCRSLGSSTGEKVIVEAGFDEIVRAAAQARLAEIRAERRASSSGQAMEPMLNSEGCAQLQEAYLASRRRSTAEVAIRDLLHAGSIIRFAYVECTIQTSWRGPMRIIPQQIGDEWEVVIIDGADNSAHPIPSRPRSDAALKALEMAFPL